jgi:hypothetical protein
MFTELLPRNGRCLQSHRLATGLYLVTRMLWGTVLISLGAECFWQEEGGEMAVKLLSSSLEPLKLISFNSFSIKVSLTSTGIHFLRGTSIINLTWYEMLYLP